MSEQDSPACIVTGIHPPLPEPLNDDRLRRCKIAYSVRRVPLREMKTLLTGEQVPRAGDLVLARVIRTRQHGRLELTQGRRARLYPGDEIIVCYGNRYAPDQFEAEIPGNLDPCHLVAAGGIASSCLSRSAKVRPPTEIEPLGLIGDGDGRRLNLADHALPALALPACRRPPVIAVAGTTMNAGKTTAAAHLIRGLVRSGCRVGAAKITGTGAGGDKWFMTDCGAGQVLDFTDAGHPSTYLLPPETIESIAHTLTGHLAREGAGVVVLEIADGLYQQETARLLAGRFFADWVDGVLFAAADAMGAVAGARALERLGLCLVGLGGALTASPLAIREAETAAGAPVFTSEALASPGIFERLQQRIDNPLPRAAAGG